MSYLSPTTGNVFSPTIPVTSRDVAFFSGTTGTLLQDLGVNYDNLGRFSGVTGFLTFGVLNIDIANSILFSGGVQSVEWVNRQLIGGDGASDLSLDWNARQLINGSAAITVDWGASNLMSGSVPSVSWGNYTLNDGGGFVSHDWLDRLLEDHFETTSVDYDNRLLVDASSNIRLNWQAGVWNDSSVAPSVDAQNRLLKDHVGVTRFNYDLTQVFDSAPQLSIDAHNRFLANSSGATVLGWGVGGVTSYNNISTAGNGVPSIYGSGRLITKTSAQASVATFTPAVDGSFIVSANVLVTASATHNFSVQVTYKDEGGTARTVTMNVQQLGGTLITAITNVTGVGPYEGVPLHIRAKAANAITVLTSGTFTSVTYNVEGVIQKIA